MTDQQYHIIVTILIWGVTLILFLVAMLLVGYIINPPKTALEKLEDKIPRDKNPSKKSLIDILNHKKFKKLPKKYQEAIKEKLASYNRTPNIIEQTMTPGQLYETKNPLWAKNINIETISAVYKLEQIISDMDVNIIDYIDEFITDCKQTINTKDVILKYTNKAIHDESLKKIQ